MLLESFYLGIALLAVGTAAPLLFASMFGKKARAVSLSILIAGLVALSIAPVSVLMSNSQLDIFAYSFMPGLDFAFSIDWLSSIFMLLVATVSISAAIYSFGYVESQKGNRRKNLLVGLMSAFAFSMIMVPASSTMFAFLFFWELMSLTSFLLVMFEHTKKETQKAGVFYFIMTQLSTVFLLIGFLSIYQVTGTFDITAVQLAGPSFVLAFLALFLGFGIKAGIIPFHKWLPYAHSASPSNISALMSGVMIKIAVYGLIRFLLSVLSPELWCGVLILIVGSVSALLGVIYALKEHDIKRLLAYHSIENIGIIFIGIGLYVIFSAYELPALAALGLAGALFHSVNHALFKSLLFLAAGSVVHATHTRNMEELGGLIKRMPKTALLFLIGAIAISALPPLNGFVSELMIFQAFLQSYAVPDPLMVVLLITCMSALALTSALAAACFVKAFGITFLGLPRSEKAKNAVEVSQSMIIGPAILAGLCIILGIFSYQILAFSGNTLGMPDMLPIGIMLLFTYAVAWAFLRYTTSNASRVSMTWGCGQPALNSRMQYTASGFSQPITRIFQPIYRTKSVREVSFFDKYGAILKGGHGEITMMKFFEEYLYAPVAACVNKLAARVAKLQNGDLDAYIAYAFIAVLAILIFLGGVSL